MSKDELIRAWKNPNYREGFGDTVDHPAGKGIVELTEEEMINLYGAGNGEIEPMSTLVCSAIISFVGSYLVTAVACKD